MAQGQFTKEEAQATIDAVDEIMKGMPKKQGLLFIGHFNDVFLFLQAAKNAAPAEEPAPSIEKPQGQKPKA